MCRVTYDRMHRKYCIYHIKVDFFLLILFILSGDNQLQQVATNIFVSTEWLEDSVWRNDERRNGEKSYEKYEETHASGDALTRPNRIRLTRKQQRTHIKNNVVAWRRKQDLVEARRAGY